MKAPCHFGDYELLVYDAVRAFGVVAETPIKAFALDFTAFRAVLAGASSAAKSDGAVGQLNSLKWFAGTDWAEVAKGAGASPFQVDVNDALDASYYDMFPETEAAPLAGEAEMALFAELFADW